ncbi:MAG TPA: carboxypeptidase-like regulatory domain-containing protein [Chloroflexia bacterium]|jgi:uncharacterized membrane protein
MFYKRFKSALLPLSMFALMVAFASMFAAGSASAAPSANSRPTSTSDTGTLLVSVIDAQSREIVNGAQLMVFDTDANVVATAIVDSGSTADTDAVQFSLMQGNYKVEITAEGYETTVVVVSVMASETHQYDVELQK